MQIIVLDGYTLNPGDLNWKGIEALGDAIVYARTPAELIIDRSQGAEILFTNKTPLNEEAFAKLPNVKYVGVLATGYNVVDVDAAKKRNIPVTNIPTYGTRSVAQMTFALLLELCHHVMDHSNATRNGAWSDCKNFCFWNFPLIELADKTMGIIGFGRIGQQVADVAEAFGMKNTAFLINTSRGSLIVEKDLAEALNSGVIAGAALDVLSVEPPSKENPLLRACNCLITPHISCATKEARARLMDIAADNLKAFLEGNAVNVVNK